MEIYGLRSIQMLLVNLTTDLRALIHSSKLVVRGMKYGNVTISRPLRISGYFIHISYSFSRPTGGTAVEELHISRQHASSRSVLPEDVASLTVA
jgi:hypothetical protein